MALDAPERLDSKPDTGKTGTSKPETGKPETGGIAAEHLRAFVDRIERLEEEKRALSSDIKDIYAEAKGSGFDVKISPETDFCSPAGGAGAGGDGRAADTLHARDRDVRDARARRPLRLRSG